MNNDSTNNKTNISMQICDLNSNLLIDMYGTGEYYWLSFADPNKPKGTQFLGVIILEANGFLNAVSKCNYLKLNPGGEIKGLLFSKEKFDKIEDKYKNKLLSYDDLVEGGFIPVKWK